MDWTDDQARYSFLEDIDYSYSFLEDIDSDLHCPVCGCWFQNGHVYNQDPVYGWCSEEVAEVTIAQGESG